MTHWSDDDALWEAMAPALTAPERLAAAEADVACIADAVRLRSNTAVADIGCGAGVHAVAFAARGCSVTGIDRSAALIRRAREHAAARGVDVSFIQEDMRRFVRPGAYDLICSLYSSFGYFDDATNRGVLRNFARSLRDGGVLVLDVLGREVLTRDWQKQAAHEIQGVLYAVERSLQADRKLLVEDWTVNRGEARDTFRTAQSVYSAPELEDMLRDAGYRRVTLQGAFDASTPYDDAAHRLVAFAFL
ncbi:MAG TPA: class I SAM-dependent methyltransferase [Vicinamibacterales bacterium]|nr:class I SAM-dependent methyltransferase [Vicinamibacterales bacterium]